MNFEISLLLIISEYVISDKKIVKETEKYVKKNISVYAGRLL